MIETINEISRGRSGAEKRTFALILVYNLLAIAMNTVKLLEQKGRREGKRAIR